MRLPARIVPTLPRVALAAVAVLTAACSGSSAGDVPLADVSSTTSAIIDQPPSPTTAASTSTSTSTSTATPATSQAPSTTIAPTGLAWRTVDVVDTTRPTDEVLDAAGTVLLVAATTRTIPTVLVYEGADGGGEDAPAATAASQPLVVWMNGLGGEAGAGDPLLLALVDAGYVVAAPNSPEVSAPASSFLDFPELPADITTVIDALLAPDDGVADDLSSLIDAERIGLAGHSLGGTGVLGSVFNECCRDARVDAAAVFGVVPGLVFESEFDFSGAPLLLIHGSADEISALAGAQEILESAAAPAYLFALQGADHFDPVYGDDSSETAFDARAVVIEFFNVYVADSSSAKELNERAERSTVGTWTAAGS